ncbi:MAG: hypothetical protein WDN08_01435 [Rhizomicrobium sp.]
MDAKTPNESPIHAFERNTMAIFAPLNDAMNHSRAYFEKSLAAMRGETMEMLSRLHDRNGEVLAECQNSLNLASLTALQERWFADFGRDLYQSSLRLQETTRHILADSFENLGQSMRNGAVAQAAHKAQEYAAQAGVQAADAAHQAKEEIEDAWHREGDAPAHPEHSA